MKKGLIYCIGGILLGVGYESLKQALGRPVFAIAALAYIVVLRLIAEKLGH